MDTITSELDLYKRLESELLAGRSTCNVGVCQDEGVTTLSFLTRARNFTDGVKWADYRQHEYAIDEETVAEIDWLWETGKLSKNIVNASAVQQYRKLVALR